MKKYGLAEEVIEAAVARRGAVHSYNAIDPTSTAFVVIDMQPYFLAPGAPAECSDGRDICKAINRLADLLRSRGGRVVWVRTEATDDSLADWANLAALYSSDRAQRRWIHLAPGHPDAALWADLRPAAGDWRVVKTRYSVFNPESSDLTARLREAGVETVLIGGVTTNVCCESPARDSMMYGFRTIMVADVNAAHTRAAHLATLQNFMSYFGDVQDCAEVAGNMVTDPAS